MKLVRNDKLLDKVNCINYINLDFVVMLTVKDGDYYCSTTDGSTHSITKEVFDIILKYGKCQE